jgi:Tol biopolymer transport system component
MRVILLCVLAACTSAIAGGQAASTGQPTPIAFTSIRSEHDLVIMRPDGSRRRVITASARDDRVPSWSPDGTRVAFAHLEGRAQRVNVLDLRTGRIRDLGEGYSPDWSPDSNRLVFLDAGARDLGTMNADGSGRRNLGLTSYGIDQETAPAWSPDGRRIAFVGTGLYVVGADGANPRKIRPEGHGGGADWSLSGREIAFDCYRRRYTVCRVRPDGSGLRGVTNGGDHPAWSRRNLIAVTFPGDPYTDAFIDVVRTSGRLIRRLRQIVDATWSPNGQRLLAAEQDTERARLYSTDPAGTVLVRLSDNPRASDHAPVWSPDGRKVAFRRLDGRGCSLAILTVATRRVRALTRNRDAGCYGRVDWSADGRRILFAAHGDLWTVPSLGGRPRRLTSTREAETKPRWAPDQRSIGFVSRGGIWLLDPSGRRKLLIPRGGPFAWSHDGSMIAFLRGSALYVRAGTGAERRLYFGVEDGPSWSSDDQKIAFTSYPPESPDGPAVLVPVPALWTTDLAGHSTMILDNAFQPDWRP